VAEAAPAAPKSAFDMMVQYLRDFKVLKDNPREYWAIQIINFLDSTAYFSFLLIGAVFFTTNLGLGDVSAGYVVTAMTVCVTLSLLISGAITDSLGIKKSLIVAIGIQTVSRIGVTVFGLWEGVPEWLTVTLPLPSGDPGFWASLYHFDFAMTAVPGRVWLAALFFILSAPGLAMTITVFQSANRRFSTKRSRSASFSLWYLIMNLGGVFAGIVVIDGVRTWKSIKLFGYTLLEWDWQPDNSWIYAIGAVCGVLSLVTATLLLRREDLTFDARETDESEALAQKEEEAKEPEKKLGAMQILKTVMRQDAFWRLMVLMVAVLGVRAVFAYMYLLMPKYWIRVIGEDVAMGTLQAVNPICIVVGIVLTIPIVGRFNVFKMLVFGAIISSLSLLALMLPWGWFVAEPTLLQSLPGWLEFARPTLEFLLVGGMGDGYFRMSVLMLIVLSVGEILWSPKLSEYCAAIAPKGMEGTYLGMSMLPWFVAKTTVGLLSGHMLLKWCPEGVGERIASGELSFWETPEAMWFVLFIWAIAGPLVAWLFRGWLTRGADLDPTTKTA
jgi:proton-dependent oligopeptide transporter, POT family